MMERLNFVRIRHLFY